MNFSVFDMRGLEIVENDTVVCSFSSGSQAYLRIGKVQEKKVTYPRYGTENYYLKIRWVEGGFLPQKPTLISVKPNSKAHILKVDLNGID